MRVACGISVASEWFCTKCKKPSRSCEASGRSSAAECKAIWYIFRVVGEAKLPAGDGVAIMPLCVTAARRGGIAPLHSQGRTRVSSFRRTAMALCLPRDFACPEGVLVTFGLKSNYQSFLGLMKTEK